MDGAVGDGQGESDLMADWASWKESLWHEDRTIVEALEAGESAALKDVKTLKRRKRA